MPSHSERQKLAAHEILEQLRELQQLAHANRYGNLGYLLQMAIIEAEEITALEK